MCVQICNKASSISSWSTKSFLQRKKTLKAISLWRCIDQHKQRSYILVFSWPWYFPICVVFWHPAWYTGGWKGTNRWEVHLNEAVQAELLIFWDKLDPRLCAKNRLCSAVSVSGAASFCWQSDFIKESKLNILRKCIAVTQCLDCK